MTLFTKLRIQNDPECHAAALGPMGNGRYGVYIGTYDESPSGSVRPRVLLTSDGVYETADEALVQGNLILEQIKAGTYEEASTKEAS